MELGQTVGEQVTFSTRSATRCRVSDRPASKFEAQNSLSSPSQLPELRPCNRTGSWDIFVIERECLCQRGLLALPMGNTAGVVRVLRRDRELGQHQPAREASRAP
jgi:hypothetical protein